MCSAGERKGEIALGNDLDFWHAFNSELFLSAYHVQGDLLINMGHTEMREAKFLSLSSLAHFHFKNELPTWKAMKGYR